MSCQYLELLVWEIDPSQSHPSVVCPREGVGGPSVASWLCLNISQVCVVLQLSSVFVSLGVRLVKECSLDLVSVAQPSLDCLSAHRHCRPRLLPLLSFLVVLLCHQPDSPCQHLSPTPLHRQVVQHRVSTALQPQEHLDGRHCCMSRLQSLKHSREISVLQGGCLLCGLCCPCPDKCCNVEVHSGKDSQRHPSAQCSCFRLGVGQASGVCHACQGFCPHEEHILGFHP